MPRGRRLLDLLIDGGDEATAYLRDLAVRKKVPKRVRTDNPQGDWLESQRRRAAERPARASGAVTASTRKPVMVSPYALASIRGENFEQRVPGEFQYDNLRAAVEKDGFRNDSPILIGMNYEGYPRIIEGNTRAAVARDLGVERIPAEIRWFAGGENPTQKNYSTLGPDQMFQKLLDPLGIYKDIFHRTQKRLGVKKARGGLAVRRANAR